MRKLALLALLTAGACGQTPQSTPAPLDRFYYPTGIALTKLANGDTALLVASSNFDLQYDTATGGTVIAVDVDATLARNQASASGPLVPVIPTGGAARIGTFAGELALVNEATCPGWEKDATTGAATGRAPLALVASRAQGALYRIGLDGAGGLSCDGASCAVALDPSSADAYGVGVACGFFPPVDASGQPLAAAAPTFHAYAFVTYLRTLNAEGRVTQLDLLDPSQPPLLVDLRISPTASVAFDAATARAYVTSRFGTNGVAPLRWLQLAAPGLAPDIFDLGAVVRGLEMRQLRLSTTEPRRGYLAMRLYDEDLAATIGARPPSDLSGALGVLDLAEQASGTPSIAVVNTVGVGRGANEVQVIPRAGQRDLVVVSSTDDDLVSLYDDETGDLAKVFSVCAATGEPAPRPCDPGKAQMGKQPFGLAVEPFTRGDIQQKGAAVPLARLYVGSFDRSWVNVVEIDPAHPAARDVAVTDPGGAPILDASGTPKRVALRWDRIGPERP